MSITGVLSVVVAVCALLFSFYMGQRTVNREKTKDEVAEATHSAIIATELKTITRNTDEIKYEMRDVRAELQRIGKEQIELNTNYFHLEQRVTKLEEKQ